MISIKTDSEIKIMRENGKILASIINQLKDKVEPGITTLELNRLAQSLVLKYEGIPSFKDYEGFPATLCTSINEQIVHGVPSDRILKEGDILSLDLGFFKNGFHSDMAITVPVGEIDSETNRLVKATKKALKRGIKKSKVGNTFGDVSNTIGRFIEDSGFVVVKDLCGHGIGKNLHEEPQILNHGKRHKGEKIAVGMVFCLEPMLAMKGEGEIKKSEDGFGFETNNNHLSAHFEHTIAITEKGPEVLTFFE
ncbi:MAG: type I methionyl aminopeptidase [Patescibacteria group bacterium]|nr:type I methionyl aminopeptidase [Patescibacteria group bacterium]